MRLRLHRIDSLSVAIGGLRYYSPVQSSGAVRPTSRDAQVSYVAVSVRSLLKPKVLQELVRPSSQCAKTRLW